MKTRHISRRFRRFAKANEAVSALEYAILVGVITVAVGAALAIFSQDMFNAIEGIGDNLAPDIEQGGQITKPTDGG